MCLGFQKYFQPTPFSLFFWIFSWHRFTKILKATLDSSHLILQYPIFFSIMVLITHYVILFLYHVKYQVLWSQRPFNLLIVTHPTIITLSDNQLKHDKYLLNKISNGVNTGYLLEKAKVIFKNKEIKLEEKICLNLFLNKWL